METTRTVNGTGSSTVSRSHHSDENGDRSYDMTSTTVISDVVHAVPREENPYPLSGTITREMTAVIVNETYNLWWTLARVLFSRFNERPPRFTSVVS